MRRSRQVFSSSHEKPSKQGKERESGHSSTQLTQHRLPDAKLAHCCHWVLMSTLGAHQNRQREQDLLYCTVRF